MQEILPGIKTVLTFQRWKFLSLKDTVAELFPGKKHCILLACPGDEQKEQKKKREREGKTREAIAALYTSSISLAVF